MKHLKWMVLCLIFFTACSEEQFENPKALTGELALGIANETNSLDTRGLKREQKNPRKVMVTFKDSNDSTIYNKQLLDLFHFNGEYLTDNVKLPIGTYTIVEYFILDSNNQVIYAAPVAGSKLAQYVNNPLHLEFEVDPDQVTQVLPEVLAVQDFKPEDFGYAHFGFDLTELVAFEIAVFDKITKQFISSKITLTGDSLYSYTDSLEAKTNLVLVSDSPAEYTFTISQTGYESQTFTYTKDELISFVEGSGLLVHLMPKDISTREMKKIAAGYYNSFFIAPDGSVYGVGDNNTGSLGIGENSDTQLTPVKMQLPAGIKAVGVVAGNNYSIIVTSDGDVYGTGGSSSGQLGIGKDYNPQRIPVKMQLPTNVKIVYASASVGGYHTLLLDSEGNVYCTGIDYAGQLGIGQTNGFQYSPVQMPLPTGTIAVDVVAGDYWSIIVDSKGNVYGVGGNSHGQLGIGNTSDQYSLVKMQLPTGVKITKVASENSCTLLLDSEGNVYGTGHNSMSQLGLGSTTNQLFTTPVKIPLPTGITATDIATGIGGSLIIGSDRNVYVAGYNSNGELGLGHQTTQSTFVKIQLPTGVEVVSASIGEKHSLLIDSNGNVYSTGHNSDGELGLGLPGSYYQLTPAKVPLPW